MLYNLQEIFIINLHYQDTIRKMRYINQRKGFSMPRDYPIKDGFCFRVYLSDLSCYSSIVNQIKYKFTVALYPINQQTKVHVVVENCEMSTPDDRQKVINPLFDFLTSNHQGPPFSAQRELLRLDAPLPSFVAPEMYCYYCCNQITPEMVKCPSCGNFIYPKSVYRLDINMISDLYSYPVNCNRCGGQIPKESRYCPTCGLPITRYPDDVQRQKTEEILQKKRNKSSNSTIFKGIGHLCIGLLCIFILVDFGAWPFALIPVCYVGGSITVIVKTLIARKKNKNESPPIENQPQDNSYSVLQEAPSPEAKQQTVPDSSPIQQSAEVRAAQQTQLCPLCGAPVALGSRFCTKCGKSLN